MSTSANDPRQPRPSGLACWGSPAGARSPTLVIWQRLTERPPLSFVHPSGSMWRGRADNDNPRLRVVR